MISFNNFRSLQHTDKIQSICDSVEVSYEGSFQPLINDIVNAWNSTEFAKAFKRVKEHAASVKYVHGN